MVWLCCSWHPIRDNINLVCITVGTCVWLAWKYLSFLYWSWSKFFSLEKKQGSQGSSECLNFLSTYLVHILQFSLVLLDIKCLLLITWCHCSSHFWYWTLPSCGWWWWPGPKLFWLTVPRTQVFPFPLSDWKLSQYVWKGNENIKIWNMLCNITLGQNLFRIHWRCFLKYLMNLVNLITFLRYPFFHVLSLTPPPPPIIP